MWCVSFSPVSRLWKHILGTSSYQYLQHYSRVPVVPVVYGVMGSGQKKKNFQLVWRCHQLLTGFLAKGHLSRVSRQSLYSRVKLTKRFLQASCNIVCEGWKSIHRKYKRNNLYDLDPFLAYWKNSILNHIQYVFKQ